MGCGRSRIESSTFPRDIHERPIRVEVMFGSSARSPGKTSPTGVIGTREGHGVGRTMKEYEDQLEVLKKENFNLKLRIYFLEERMGITSADENAVKKNIELKVEIESLRKELLEKQELLSQAAKAFELIEEQKAASSRDQAQYQKSLEVEREKIRQLEKELEEYRDKVTDASIYYKEAFGITPEKAMENEEKLHQMEELVSSLEAEVKQVTSSLEEERIWAQELETERDEFRNCLETETRMRESLDAERVRDIEELREKLKELEEQLLKRDTLVQQCRSELAEKDRIIKERTSQLEEKCRSFEEASSISEKRKRQIDQLRASIKSRDDALTDLNTKHRSLLSQFENGYAKRSPPTSPLALNGIEDPLQLRMGQKLTSNQATGRRGGSSLDWEPNREKSLKLLPSTEVVNGDTKDPKKLVKELEEKESELKQQEEAKKQLVLKLCNAQKHAEMSDHKLKKLEGEHEKAIKAIQGFIERQQQLETTKLRKEQKIKELEDELTRLRDAENQKVGRISRNLSNRRYFTMDTVDDPERDHSNQQRFDEMEAKINDLRDQIETSKAEKTRLERQLEVESEELQDRLNDRDQRIEILEIERHTMTEDLADKNAEIAKLKVAVETKNAVDVISTEKQDDLLLRLGVLERETQEKNQKIEQLTKELQVKTQNLQKLVNTELWSKNKEIAKLHNHMTATYSQERSRNKSESLPEGVSTHLSSLVKELNDIGIQVTFTNGAIQLNYLDGNDSLDVTSLAQYMQKLAVQKNELEKEVDYLKWLKLVSKPDIQTENCEYVGSETERAKKYCELLRTHMKDLMQFMKEMLKNSDHRSAIGNEYKSVLEIFLKSKILPDDFMIAVQDSKASGVLEIENDEIPGSVVKSLSENVLSIAKNHVSTQSDSEAFSEPDRTVSMARMGLQETQQKSWNRPRFSKYSKDSTDSEDSLEYVPYYKTYQNDLNDPDSSRHTQELKEANALHEDFTERTAQMQFGTDKKIQRIEFYPLKKESKQNIARKTQLENITADVKQKSELIRYKEETDANGTDILINLTSENDTLKARIKKLEDEHEAAKTNILALTKELDHLTLLHSQLLVENTKLANEKLRLEQEVRKTEGRCDVTVRSIHEKYNKEISDLNQINDSQRVRLQELEVANKELRRHVAVCEASDSAPSSSGVSSIPADAVIKQNCDDIMHEYQSYNNSQYWLPVSYPTLGARSKSSCSPDLGIESDAAVTTMRPLKDTLTITESMTNLLSDDDNGNANRPARDVDNESPLPLEGVDALEALKQENETLKRRLMKTRKALEDTFQHLSASNKNKNNVEKAITKQLQITKSILKKTRTFEEALEN